MSNFQLSAYDSIEVIMREMAVATQLNNKGIIEYLYANVKAKIDFCKTILTCYDDNNFSYLLFACDETFVAPCEEILRDIIIEYIESVYKVEYLTKKIKNPLCDRLTFSAYIKVLALFDKETDQTALKDILCFNQTCCSDEDITNFSETLHLDSFLTFRLNPLKRHWDNLAELSSDNVMLFNSGTFLDVIRFLINTMDNLVYKIKVVIKDDHYCIYNMKNKNAKIKKIAECDDSVDFITNVLNSCPNYIDVYLNTNQECEAVSFLSNIFSNRLKVFTKC